MEKIFFYGRITITSAGEHQIRNSLKYVSYKEQKLLMADLKKVYQALTLEEAEMAFDDFKEKWGKKHPIVIRSWENNWLELTAYFKYPYEIRRIIYTTNIIEGYHRQFDCGASPRSLMLSFPGMVVKRWGTNQFPLPSGKTSVRRSGCSPALPILLAGKSQI